MKPPHQAVFEFQVNCNPFVDHPEFVEMVWGKLTTLVKATR
ncbi:hypothetical protein AB6C60_09835 [Vibrio cyclitrophicus]